MICCLQDNVWMPKCLQYGWFLPYQAPDNEFGAWKKYFLGCVQTPDYTPALDTLVCILAVRFQLLASPAVDKCKLDLKFLSSHIAIAERSVTWQKYLCHQIIHSLVFVHACSKTWLWLEFMAKKSPWGQQLVHNWVRDQPLIGWQPVKDQLLANWKPSGDFSASFAMVGNYDCGEFVEWTRHFHDWGFLWFNTDLTIFFKNVILIQ